MIFWTVVGFVLGSIPFSVWLGRLALHRDIRNYGDGNPGAANVWRAGGWRAGVVALLLDCLKGAVPVGLARFHAGLSGWELAPVAVAPILGHAVSPFLHFRGGKAIAATFGVWTALTLWQGPLVLGLCLGLFYMLQRNDGWAVMLGMIGVLAYFVLTRQASSPILPVWAANTAIFTWKHWPDLQRGIELRPSVARLLQRQTHER